MRLEHKTVVLGRMVQGETFGEMSFLIPNRTQGAYGSVIADTDEVDLVIIEGYYINALFNISWSFAGDTKSSLTLNSTLVQISVLFTC